MFTPPQTGMHHPGVVPHPQPPPHHASSDPSLSRKAPHYLPTSGHIEGVQAMRFAIDDEIEQYGNTIKTEPRPTWWWIGGVRVRD